MRAIESSYKLFVRNYYFLGACIGYTKTAMLYMLKLLVYQRAYNNWLFLVLCLPIALSFNCYTVMYSANIAAAYLAVNDHKHCVI